MTKKCLVIAMALSLISTPALAGALVKLSPGAEQPSASAPAIPAYAGDAYEAPPVQDRNRLADDEEDVAKDKDALARDREGFRWWLLNDDKRHLEEDQAKLCEDYDTYARDAHDGPGEDLGGLRAPE